MCFFFKERSSWLVFLLAFRRWKDRGQIFWEGGTSVEKSSSKCPSELSMRRRTCVGKPGGNLNYAFVVQDDKAAVFVKQAPDYIKVPGLLRCKGSRGHKNTGKCCIFLFVDFVSCGKPPQPAEKKMCDLWIDPKVSSQQLAEQYQTNTQI